MALQLWIRRAESPYKYLGHILLFFDNIEVTIGVYFVVILLIKETLIFTNFMIFLRYIIGPVVIQIFILVILAINTISKNYRQTHKMGFVLFASVINSFFDK